MKQFAVFDIDGTLIRWQLYHVMVDRLAAAGELSSTTLNDLKSARLKWKNRENPDSFAQYERVLIELFENSIKTVDTKTFDTVVPSVIKEYKNQVYTFTRDLVRKLKSDGYMLLAISGSHHELVTEIAKAYGFDDWVGTHYQRENGAFNGASFIASNHKAELLKEFVQKHDLSLAGSYAVGDSKSDAPMLEMVENPVAFNPDKNLFEIAKQNHWNIVIERKNMVYKLASNGSEFTLQSGNLE